MGSMTSSPLQQSSAVGSGRHFATTRWSLILAAQQEGTAASETALATLCESYWYPLYSFVRRQGYQEAEAQDFTQDFFARLLEKNDLQDVGRERGKFRSFLLASLKHFLSNARDRQQAARRGGRRQILSLDFQYAEERYRHEPSDHRTPEAEFDRQWALTLLAEVREALERQWRLAGKADQFTRLSPYLTGAPAVDSYRQAGEALGMSEGAVKVAVHRLRQRFGQLLRETIAQTVGTDEEVEAEVQQLFEALRG